MESSEAEGERMSGCEKVEHKEYEEYDEAEDDDSGAVFEVEIFFYDKNKEAIIEYICEELGWEKEIISVRNNYVKILWVIPPGGEELYMELTLFYALKEETLGLFKYRRVDL